MMSTVVEEKALDQMDLTLLADYCVEELQRRRYRQSGDDRFCLELFYRATVLQIEGAWSVMQQILSEVVRIWLRSHPGRELALLYDSEENYIAQTFSRFWFAVQKQHLEFSSLPAALSYLHCTLNGLLIDTLRIFKRSDHISLADTGLPDEPAVEDTYHGDEMWQSIARLLDNEQERRLAYLLYYCGLKPREIAQRFPEMFHDVKEVYRLNYSLLGRLRRNRERLRVMLDGEW